MFENLFVVYNMVEPPEIYKDNIDLVTEDIENSNITNLDFKIDTDFNDYPGVTSPLWLNEETITNTSEFIKEKPDNQESTSSTEDVKVSNNTKIFSSSSDFVNTLNSIYEKVLQDKGLDPKFSTMLVALDALETGWGKYVKGNFNYGNITAGNGEDWHNQTGKRKWRDFKSIEDYVNKKIDFLSRPRYRFFETFTPSSNVSIAMQILANRGYDPGNYNYGKAVAEVYNSVIKKK